MGEATGGLRVGVVGLGMMGSGMATSLDAAGLLEAVVDARSEVFEERPELVDPQRPEAATPAAG